MSDKKQLNEEELEKVSGGFAGDLDVEDVQEEDEQIVKNLLIMITQMHSLSKQVKLD